MELLDVNLPVKDRVRALHALKDNFPQDDPAKKEEYMQILIDAFPTTDSVLLKHEIAFTLGQIAHKGALPHLFKWLHDEAEDVVTRHECAEAIGAIGDPSGIPELLRYESSGPQELQETVHLALKRMAWIQSGAKEDAGVVANPYSSIDPAPACADKSIEELSSQLMDDKLDLYERYQAMFALRNKCTTEAVKALCDGFKDTTSALFRHEIAYVLGQMEHPASREALIQILQNDAEHPMVRHEAAEALGSLAEDGVMEALSGLKDADEKLVGDSCAVGLDMTEYWSKWKAPAGEVSAGGE